MFCNIKFHFSLFRVFGVINLNKSQAYVELIGNTVLKTFIKSLLDAR